MANLKQ